MFQNCNFIIRIVLSITLAVGLAACEIEESRNPLSPNIAGPIEGVNITAPALVEPINGILVETGSPVVLKFGGTTSNSERPFWFEVELARDGFFQDMVHQASAVAPQESGIQGAAEDGTHSYQIPDALEPDQTYWWRTRAADGANTGPYSDAHAFELFTPVTVGVPEPKSPVGGAVITGRRPRLEAETPRITGPATGVRLQFEISSRTSFANPVATLTVGSSGNVTGALSGNLAWGTTYFWRVRATAKGREGDVGGAWSRTASFKTPPAPVTTPAPAPAPTPPPPSGGGGGFRRGGSPNAPFTTGGGNPPNMSHVVRRVAADHPAALANSCPHEGGSWEFLDRVVEALREIDGRWAYNCKRGDCGSPSVDVVDYYRGQGNPHGSTDVAIIDVISAVCGPGANPGPRGVTSPRQRRTPAQSAAGSTRGDQLHRRDVRF